MRRGFPSIRQALRVGVGPRSKSKVTRMRVKRLEQYQFFGQTIEVRENSCFGYAAKAQPHQSVSTNPPAASAGRVC